MVSRTTLLRRAGPLTRSLATLSLALGLSTASLAQDADTPLYGGAMIVGLATDPAGLNIGLTTNLSESMVTAGIFNKLVRLGADESFLPELAESWEVAEDGMSYTFHLDDGITWHDGTPFTSADVKFTIEEITRPFHPQGNTLETVASVETPDDNTVVVNLTEPGEPVLVFLALRTYILPKHLYEGTDIRENPANVTPVGTGPFKFVEWERGSHITLERNEDYFQEGMPYLDQMIYQILPDASSRVLALETGQVDYLTHDIPSTSLDTLGANPDIVVSNEGVSSIVNIGQMMLNHDREPYSDVNVRKALTMALDKDFIAERATLGAFERADGPIHSATAWAYDADAITLYPYDVAAAEALLDEAGYPRGADGTRFTMELLVPRGREDQMRAGDIIAELYKAIGVNVTINLLDAAALSEVSYVNRNFDAMINTVTTGPDPSIGVQRQYVTSNIRPVPFTNAAGYSNPDVDALFAEAAIEVDRATRAEIYSEVQRLLTEDAPVIWLWDTTPYSAWRNTFTNIHNDSAAANYYLWSAWWTEGEAR
jgi:peptide/nickel transport system substrate-binding protein